MFWVKICYLEVFLVFDWRLSLLNECWAGRADRNVLWFSKITLNFKFSLKNSSLLRHILVDIILDDIWLLLLLKNQIDFLWELAKVLIHLSNFYVFIIFEVLIKVSYLFFVYWVQLMLHLYFLKRFTDAIILVAVLVNLTELLECGQTKINCCFWVLFVDRCRINMHRSINFWDNRNLVFFAFRRVVFRLDQRRGKRSCLKLLNVIL